MKVIEIFLLQVIVLLIAQCRKSNGVGSSGGPSAFGYDASSACSRSFSRTGRTQLPDLPCDFRRQNWCTIAGSSYPWHAVRRFVQENQGLMRRMYGVERHINVLKAEFNRNDIELQYDKAFHHSNDHSRGFEYGEDYDTFRPKRHESWRSYEGEYEVRGYTNGRSLNNPPPHKQSKFPKLSEYTRSHLHAAESLSTTSTTNTPTVTSARSTTSTTSATNARPTTTSGSLTSSTSTTTTSVPTTMAMNTTSNSSSTTADEMYTTPSSLTMRDNITTMEYSNRSSIGDTLTTTAPTIIINQTHIVKEQNFSINEIPSQVDRIDEGVVDDSIELRIPYDSIEEDTTLGVVDTTLKPEVFSSTIENEKDETRVNGEEQEEEEDGGGDEEVDDGDGEVEEEEDDRLFEETFITVRDSPTVTTTTKPATVDYTTVASKEQQQFRPRPEYKPSSKPDVANMEGQLFQDVAAKDEQQQPVLKLRGVNACPVKEEVVAPFWANNTRGEVLALLNLPPFEQYVHWEKCTHENKQMYCRDGCRCEQQYRLHRLLAYDPNNECRGIFSDWFKFPSCCVCRCYDLPLEFRVTSRSPRTQKRKIRVRLPRARYFR